jgi:hypothetical protein
MDRLCNYSYNEDFKDIYKNPHIKFVMQDCKS